jgi:hypothetical protein
MPYTHGFMCGGQLTSTWTSLAPACLRLVTRDLQVVPRTMESSTMTTRLPRTRSAMRLSFTRTLKSRMSLGGLEEAASDVVIADEGHFVRDAGLEGIAEGGVVAAVGDGHHDVGFDRDIRGPVGGPFRRGRGRR